MERTVLNREDKYVPITTRIAHQNYAPCVYPPRDLPDRQPKHTLHSANTRALISREVCSFTNPIGSFHDDIVTRSQHTIRAGRVDFHLFARELVKEIWSSPAVAHFSTAIHTRSLRNRDFDLLEVVAGKCFRDFRVIADRIFTQHRAVISQSELDVVDFVADLLDRHWGFCTGDNTGR